MTRCSDEHLLSKHNIEITPIRMILDKVVKLAKAETVNKASKEKKLSRREMVGYAEKLIQPDLERLRHFLNHIV